MEIQANYLLPRSADQGNLRSAHREPTLQNSQQTNVAGAVEVLLDLSRGARDLLGAVFGLPAEDLQAFLKLSTDLLKQGVVGSETLKVRGRPYKSFVPSQIADPYLYDAPLYHDRPPSVARKLDLTA